MTAMLDLPNCGTLPATYFGLHADNMPSSFVTGAVLIRHDRRKENMTGGDTPSFRCGLCTRPAAQNAHALFPLSSLRFFFRTFPSAWAAGRLERDRRPGAHRREYQIMDLAWKLGGTRLSHKMELGCQHQR